MKRLIPFTSLILFTAITFLFASCGGGDKKTTETPTGDTTTTPDAKVNTIVTTPQLMTLIKHKVKNFAAWKAAYDGHDSARLANGLHSYVIGRGMDDSMIVMIAMKADDLEKAKAFAKDPALKERMQKGGVVGAPEITFVNVVWQDTVNVGSIPRVITSFTVKDFDVAKKGFEEGRQERMDNGIADRQYGHEADDNHKVSMVTALNDVDKAKAYWASDAIKKRLEAGGLTTQPQRFIFNIVQRYR
jgi:hypothetical protein